LFSYLLTAPSLEKRYKVYCKTPFFREELSGYAMMLGETSKDELLDWGRQLGGCLSVAENLLIAKAIALFQNKSGLFWANSRTAFYKLPVYYLWPVATKTLDDFFETGFTTIGSLQEIPLESLEGRLGEEGKKIYNYCRGIDHTQIRPNPPFFEKVFRSKDPDQVLLSLMRELPKHAKSIWLTSEKSSIELCQDKIGRLSLSLALKALFPWETLTCLVWEMPKAHQKSLFDFSLPDVVQSLLDQEKNLTLGISVSRREKVRRSNFIWGYGSGSYLGKTHSN
jgi:hypothetical protein